MTFSVGTLGLAPISCQWQKNGVAISGATSLSYTIASCQPSDAGTYTAVLTNPLGSVTSNAAVLTVNASVTVPSITTQPSSKTVSVGQSVTFTIAVGGSPAPTLQWYLNGTAIAGATNATLLITGATSGNAGSYTCVATNSAGSVTSAAATLTVSGASCPDRLINLSVLAEVRGTLTVGFVVGSSSDASGSKTLLIRCTGPALTTFGVTGVMPDPQFVVRASSNAVVMSNAGWGGDNQLSAAANFVGAFGLANPASGDSAALLTVNPGAYTIQVSSVTGLSGNVLVEVYEVP